MPFYVYQPSSDSNCAHCEQGFEALQKLDAAPLTGCPDCGAPVKKMLTAPSISKSGPSLDQNNIEKHGFTQYKKLEKGVYEKTAGSGPDIISDKPKS